MGNVVNLAEVFASLFGHCEKLVCSTSNYVGVQYTGCCKEFEGTRATLSWVAVWMTPLKMIAPFSEAATFRGQPYANSSSTKWVVMPNLVTVRQTA